MIESIRDIEEYLIYLNARAVKAFPVNDLEAVCIVTNSFSILNRKIFQVWISICDKNGNPLDKYSNDLKRSFIEETSIIRAMETLDMFVDSILDRQASIKPSRVLEEGEAMFEANGFGD